MVGKDMAQSSRELSTAAPDSPKRQHNRLTQHQIQECNAKFEEWGGSLKGRGRECDEFAASIGLRTQQVEGRFHYLRRLQYHKESAAAKQYSAEGDAAAKQYAAEEDAYPWHRGWGRSPPMNQHQVRYGPRGMAGLSSVDLASSMYRRVDLSAAAAAAVATARAAFNASQDRKGEGQGASRHQVSHSPTSLWPDTPAGMNPSSFVEEGHSRPQYDRHTNAERGRHQFRQQGHLVCKRRKWMTQSQAEACRLKYVEWNGTLRGRQEELARLAASVGLSMLQVEKRFHYLRKQDKIRNGEVVKKKNAESPKTDDEGSFFRRSVIDLANQKRLEMVRLLIDLAQHLKLPTGGCNQVKVILSPWNEAAFRKNGVDVELLSNLVHLPNKGSEGVSPEAAESTLFHGLTSLGPAERADVLYYCDSTESVLAAFCIEQALSIDHGFPCLASIMISRNSATVDASTAAPAKASREEGQQEAYPCFLVVPSDSTARVEEMRCAPWLEKLLSLDSVKDMRMLTEDYLLGTLKDLSAAAKASNATESSDGCRKSLDDVLVSHSVLFSQVLSHVPHDFDSTGSDGLGPTEGSEDSVEGEEPEPGGDPNGRTQEMDAGAEEVGPGGEPRAKTHEADTGAENTELDGDRRRKRILSKSE